MSQAASWTSLTILSLIYVFLLNVTDVPPHLLFHVSFLELLRNSAFTHHISWLALFLSITAIFIWIDSRVLQFLILSSPGLYFNWLRHLLLIVPLWFTLSCSCVSMFVNLTVANESHTDLSSLLEFRSFRLGMFSVSSHLSRFLTRTGLTLSWWIHSA